MNAARRRHLTSLICSDLDGMPAAKADRMPSYFVVAQFYGRAICADGVDPELTRSNIVDRIRTKEYDAIAFIHWCHDGQCDDVTNKLLAEAGFYDEQPPEIDRQAARFDHERDERKHWERV